MLRSSAALSAFFCLGLFGCSASSSSTQAAVTSPEQADEPGPDDAAPTAWAEPSLDGLEGRLSAAGAVELEFAIESSGAVESTLEGRLRWERGGAVELDAVGSFAGAEQQLAWRGSADAFEVLVAGASTASGPRPPGLEQAIVLGLTRQGLLHNLAMATAGAMPSYLEGQASAALGFADPEVGAVETLGEGEARPLHFGVRVDGQAVGEATLWFARDGLPVERRQTVHFPEGDMMVVERYAKWQLSE